MSNCKHPKGFISTIGKYRVCNLCGEKFFIDKEEPAKEKKPVILPEIKEAPEAKIEPVEEPKVEVKEEPIVEEKAQPKAKKSRKKANKK